MADEVKNDKAPLPSGTGQAQGPPKAPPDTKQDGRASTSGNRQALRDLRRELTEEELKQPGVQKLLLDMLAQADYECSELKPYVDKYHDADKKSCILEEKNKRHTYTQILSDVCFCLGGALLGLAPTFWKNPPAGPFSLVIGALLIIGAAIAKLVTR